IVCPHWTGPRGPPSLDQVPRWIEALRDAVPPAGILYRRDTNEQPDHPRGITPHHVTEIVDAEIQAAHADRENQNGSTCHDPESFPVVASRQRAQDVSEHAVPNEGSHRVSAGEAPGDIVHQGGGVARP